mmetsp:Transcript_92973/g.194321  ORF Transcript_92973/g.194321 Transcript_92973/m.194321 type:complete len:119 (-) Transcript_92973:83-439(-)
MAASICEKRLAPPEKATCSTSTAPTQQFLYWALQLQSSRLYEQGQHSQEDQTDDIRDVFGHSNKIHLIPMLARKHDARRGDRGKYTERDDTQHDVRQRDEQRQHEPRKEHKNGSKGPS